MKSTRRIILFGLLGLAILAGTGTFYHLWAEKYDLLTATPLMPPVPLKDFPMELGQWQGSDVPISDTVLKVAGVDDHISRSYTNQKLRTAATLYVGYTTEPRRMLGHRPQICYVGSGWTHDYTRPEMLRTSSGEEIEVLIHRFYWPGQEHREVFVLNYYVLNGQLTTDEGQFSGLRWRRPRQDGGGRLQYVAQIQISSASEQAILALAKEVADPMMTYMP